MLDLGHRYHHREEGWIESCPAIVCPSASNDQIKLTRVSQPKYNEIRNISQRTASSTDVVSKPAVVKKEAAKGTPQVSSGADLPGISTSKIDVDAKPIYEPAGKPITQVNIDEGKFA